MVPGLEADLLTTGASHSLSCMSAAAQSVCTGFSIFTMNLWIHTATASTAHVAACTKILSPFSGSPVVYNAGLLVLVLDQ